MVPTPATLFFSLPASPRALWGAPYDHLTEDEKTWVWIMDGSA